MLRVTSSVSTARGIQNYPGRVRRSAYAARHNLPPTKKPALRGLFVHGYQSALDTGEVSLRWALPVVNHLAQGEEGGCIFK